MEQVYVQNYIILKQKYINNKVFKLKSDIEKNTNFIFDEADRIIRLLKSNNDISTSFI